METTENKPRIADLKIFKQNTAERLKDIAMTARSRSMAERLAYQATKKAEEMAEDGYTEFKDKIMTLEFFKANKSAMPIPEGEDVDEYVQKLYDSQKESYSLMEQDGFKVTYDELELDRKSVV